MTLLTEPDARPDLARDDEWHLHRGDEIVPGRTVVRLLGGGRRYQAYLAYDESLLTTVVVKVLRPLRAGDDAALAGMTDEYSALRALNHPSLPRGFDLVVEGPRPHLVLEHVEGPRLSTLIRRFSRLDLEQLVPLAVEVGAALHYMHHCGFVHLDVKPQNIIMAGPPRLIDLSVATTIEDAGTLRSVVGTDAYMAPEQSRPGDGVEIGAAADVWGLGATLYEAVTGHLPYPRPSDEDRHPQQHVVAVPLAANLPQPLRNTIMASLDPDPTGRPSAREVVLALETLGNPLPRKIVLGRIRPRL